MSASSNKRHFLLNMASSYGSNILGTIISFISVPIALQYWGDEKYSVWIIITSLAVYLGMSGLGVDVAAGLLMVKNADLSRKRVILNRGLVVTAISAVLFFLVLALFSYFVPDWVRFIGKISAENIGIAKYTAIIFILSFLINLPLGTIGNSFAAYEKTYISIVLSTLLGVLTFLLLIITKALKFSLVQYSLLYCSLTFAFNLFRALVLFHIRKKYEQDHAGIVMTPQESDEDDTKYSTLMKMGLRLAVYGIALLGMTNIGNFIISNKMSAAMLVPYSLTFKLLSVAFNFLCTFNNASAPIFGKEYGKKNWDWIVASYKRLFCFSFAFAGFIIVGMSLFIKDFIDLWVGRGRFSGMPIVFALSLYFINVSLQNINTIIINSFNYTKKVWLVMWCDAILFIVLSFVLIEKMKTLGVALAMGIGTSIVSSWALPLVIYRRSGKRLRYDFKFMIVMLVCVLAFMISATFVNSLIGLMYIRIPVDFIFLSCFCVLAYFIFPKEMRGELLGLIKKSASRFRKS
jgi:O-antigen/teichoic acid export membrane protein